MYDIRQFKPALYVLLMLGLTCFGLAAELPGVWVLAVGSVLLHLWLSRIGVFRPMPRLVANLATIAAFAYVVMFIRQSAATPIIVVGEFLVFLQIVKLYELRANRDYAQLLVLSLLLVVAATISTASLLFFLFLVCYLFLSLYCCLLFHLKIETDHAKAVLGIGKDMQNPTTLRQDERYLPRSMRRLTGLVSITAVITAVVVFLFFPRGPGAGLFGPVQYKVAQSMTGFSEQVSFQNIAKITQNEEVVARVKVTKNGEPLHGTEPLLLRGLTLDVYSGAKPATGGQWQWIRSQAPEILEPETANLGATTRPVTEEEYIQDVTLYPTGTTVLFAVGGVTSVQNKPQDLRFKYARRDEVLQLMETVHAPINYRVTSRNALTEAPPVPEDGSPQAENRPAPRRWPYWGGIFSGRRGRQQGDDVPNVPLKSELNPKILEYAMRPAVSGEDADGNSLAAARDAKATTTDLDLQIAQNIQSHLRNTFSYTLDLTDATQVAGRDPLESFLYDFKRGHCEYFAGAMTLMCQTLGMQARMAIGFRCDDYNSFGEYYNVKQSHAHAWVEVLGTDGIWHTFDPTSSREASPGAVAGAWRRFKNFFDYLDYSWANSVIAYDRTARANLISNTQDSVATTAVNTSDAMTSMRGWLNRSNFLRTFSGILSGLVMLMVSMLVGSILWYLHEQWKLRERARRIGLDALPPGQQMKLARQLRFYDDLLLSLERRQIVRPVHLTPLEFSESITYVPNEAYDAIGRLTEIFYRVRYGRAELTPGRRKHLDNVVRRIDHLLGHPGHAAARAEPT